MQAVASVRRYKQVKVHTASAGQILVALYETAVRYARMSAASIRERDVVAKGKQIQRVSDIVAELNSTLKPDVAPELCADLEALYAYMQERLSVANALMDAEAAEEVARLLDTLREAWTEAVRQVEGRA